MSKKLLTGNINTKYWKKNLATNLVATSWCVNGNQFDNQIWGKRVAINLVIKFRKRRTAFNLANISRRGDWQLINLIARSQRVNGSNLVTRSRNSEWQPTWLPDFDGANGFQIKYRVSEGWFGSNPITNLDERMATNLVADFTGMSGPQFGYHISKGYLALNLITKNQEGDWQSI